MSPFAQFVLVGLGTYLTRLSAVGLAGRFGSPSAEVEATLRLIAPAVLAAIVADRLFLRDGEFDANWTWWLAAIVAGLVAVRWRSAAVTMVVGIAVVWILDGLT